MKTFLSLCMVLAVAALASGAEKLESVDDSKFQALAPRILLFRNVYIRPAVPNVIQTDEVVFRGDGRTRIRGINQQEQGASQGVQVGRVSGGIGTTHVTLHIRSQRGRGYNLLIEIWA